MNRKDNFFLDKDRVRATFNKAATRYENFDFLQREVALRLLERLDDRPRIANLILDLGCGTGRTLPRLQKRFSKAKLVCLDIAEIMLFMVV